MSSVRVPASLRRAVSRPGQAKPSAPKKESKAATLFTAALLAAASPVSIAVAQGTLPPLSVETTEAKKKAKTTPTAKAGKAAPVVEAPPPSTAAKDANPYANPDAPYNVERSASGKLTEPLVNTARTVTAIPREVIEDRAATSLRDLARQTPGVTIGFAEGGNAFGDTIYIRGFQARGDIFIDGLRDPGNTSRDVFAVEQIEIYKGPGSAISGRGTPGGAVNFITKQPNPENNFYNVSTMFGTDHTIRTMVDVNQIVTPTLTVRGSVMYHQSEVAGRDFAEDERWGGFFSALYKPSDTFKLTVDYYRFRSDGTPDWGVPINTATKKPWTELGVDRDTWYGNALRDFIKTDSDTITARAELKLAPGVTYNARTRYGVNVADYIASFPQDPNPADGVVNVGNPQRYQEFESISHQSDVTFKFSTGAWKHTLVAGVEVARDNVGRYSYSGLQSPPAGTVSLTDPDPYRGFANVGPKTLTFDAKIDTRAAYLLDTIKLSPQWFINGGVRWDSFRKRSSRQRHQHRKSRGQFLLLPCWHRLQANTDSEHLCGLRNRGKSDRRRAGFNRCAIWRVVRRHGAARSRGKHAASRSAPNGSCSTSVCLPPRLCSRQKRSMRGRTRARPQMPSIACAASSWASRATSRSAGASMAAWS